MGSHADRDEERAGDHDSGEHRNENAEAEDEREALDERRAEPEENDGRNHRGNVRVADREPCAREAVVDRITRILPCFQFATRTSRP